MCDYCNGQVPIIEVEEDGIALYICVEKEAFGKYNTFIEARYNHQQAIMSEHTNFKYCPICGEKLKVEIN